MKDRISAILAAGDVEALMPLVYDELRGLAAAQLKRERAGHSLQPTALANEAYFKLVDTAKAGMRGRAHFFGVAARAMRQVLVEYARKRQAAKRGGDLQRVTLSIADGVGSTPRSAVARGGVAAVVYPPSRSRAVRDVAAAASTTRTTTFWQQKLSPGSTRN